MSDAQDLSNSVEIEVSNFFKKASIVDESPVIEGLDNFFEVTDVSALGGDSTGSNEGANGDRSGGGDFAITVNGTSPTTNTDGLPVYATSASLSCNSGNVILFTGTAGNQITHSGSFTASFPIGNGFEYFGVYGKVIYESATSNQRTQPSTFVSGSIEIDTSANVATAFKDGFTRDANFDTNGRLVYMFRIGVVALQKDGLNRFAYVNQLQTGDHTINSSSETDSSVTPNVDIGDGPRQVTLCINGNPFTGLINVTGIKKV